MLSVSLENNSGLFGTDVYDETKENKPKYEHEEGLEFGSDFDFDGEFEKYAAMGAAEKQSGAWMTNFKNLEFPLGVSPSVLVQTLGIFAAFCGILSGVDQSLISGASIGMDKSLHFNSHENSLVSSLMPLGAVAGSILLTPLQRFGRKKALMASCILYTYV
ncbi:MFS transporter%2C sugar porter (SP) family [Chlamydia trachomatis]|nr:MFS transporter%2C sugar porter (SP) family [Chlamydia trachomatis]